MKFTEHFGLDAETEYEWFDPLLNLDTKLFIDPFLIYDNEDDEFVGSHADVVGFFQKQFELVAKSKGDTKSAAWQRALDNLLFPEVEELCLGYTSYGTDGSGSGAEVARRIRSAIWKAITDGVAHIEHFEEVQLFEENIAEDRISDAIAKILLARFAKYTERQCKTLRIPTKRTQFPRVRFDLEKNRWVSGIFKLPQNPHNGKAILLCPKHYLRIGPTINPDSFWEYVRTEEPEIARREFGEDIVSHLNKKPIIDIARKYPDTRERYIAFQENEGAKPYDFSKDPKGLIDWYTLTSEWIRKTKPTLSFKDEPSFQKFILELIKIFQNYVENQGGWKLLWNDNNTPRSEEAAQRLFQGIVMHACSANNVDLSREVNIGRGPVDYKVSQGATFKALIELKLARNSRFWNGLEKQLPKYMEAEAISIGHFLVVSFNDKDLEKTLDIEKRTRAVAKKLAYAMDSTVLDASDEKPSASKLGVKKKR